MPRTIVKVEATIHAPIEVVWKNWTTPSDIMQWNNASDDWHTTKAENDLKAGGKFLSRMEAKDGSIGFDFEGLYESVKINEHIEYGMADGRKVKVEFVAIDNSTTHIMESFDAEEINSIELQQAGWQSILDNFKKHVEKAHA